MILTRATDNRLKAFFTGSEVRYGSGVVPGEGLPLARTGGDLRRRRSACGAATRIRDDDGSWAGDVVGPMIRDAGAVARDASRRRRPSA